MSRTSRLRDLLLALLGVCLLLGLAPFAALDAECAFDLDEAHDLLSPAAPDAALPALFVDALRPARLLASSGVSSSLVRPPTL